MEKMDNYTNWYHRTFVQFEIVKQLKNRETAFYDAKNKRMWRCIKAHSIDYLKKNFNAFSFFNKRFKIYHSLAVLNQMPVFSWNAKKRKEQQDSFNKEFENYAVTYDFGLDVDGVDGSLVTTSSSAWLNARKIKEELDTYHVPYSLKFSGKKGFHFLVDHSYFSLSFNEAVQAFKQVAHNLKEVLNVSCLDDSIYDARRIFKVAYSLDTGGSKNFDYVVLPLTDEQFENFELEDCRVENVLESLKLKNRGLLERKGSKKHVEEFLKDWRY